MSSVEPDCEVERAEFGLQRRGREDFRTVTRVEWSTQGSFGT